MSTIKITGLILPDTPHWDAGGVAMPDERDLRTYYKAEAIRYFKYIQREKLEGGNPAPWRGLFRQMINQAKQFPKVD